MSAENYSTSGAAALGDAAVAPKVLGGDFELGNFILGFEDERRTGAMASRALLREIDGLPGPPPGEPDAWSGGSGYGSVNSSQDWGRKYLPANGGCVYIDLDHLECCTPEVLSAYDFAAATHAMLRIARSALQAANSRLQRPAKVVAIVNNEDGQGHSYGSHLSLQMTRSGWDRLFHRRLHQLLMLASFQVSSIALTGQGKVNSTGRAASGEAGWYELSQRASFFECLVGPQTTYNRPLVNSRDEALCGRPNATRCPADRFARLHSIFFDATLCPASIVLRAGLMQLLLSALEGGDNEANLRLLLEDPVDTVARWSCDPMLAAGAGLLTGEQVTALELQRRFFDLVSRFVESGRGEGSVPAARELLALWADTLDKLSRRDFPALAGRLDWVLKLQLLERAMEQHRGLGWGSPEIKHLDFKYADLEDGLFWACEQAGAVERAGVTEEQVCRFTHQPPVDTRAWTRARLLRLADPETVADVDWDKITFKLRSQMGREFRRTLMLSNPLGFTRRDTEPVLRHSDDLGEALDLLGAPDRDPEPISTAGHYWLSPYYPTSPATKYVSTWSAGQDPQPPSSLQP